MTKFGMAAIAAFFLQFPSWLPLQKQLKSRQGRSNAKILVRHQAVAKRLDGWPLPEGIPPEHIDPMSHRVINRLKKQIILDPLRWRADAC